MLDTLDRPHRHRNRIVARCASNPTDVRRAMSLNGRIYERLYRTHWAVPPDVFLIAESDGIVSATAGLVFAAAHREIPSERYFDNGPTAAKFFAEERARIAEVGRLTSTNTAALRAVLDAAIEECLARGIAYLVGWTSPPVRIHVAETCGLHFRELDARLNLGRALEDRSWVTTPTGFFVRDDAPQLLVSELAAHRSAFAAAGRAASSSGPDVLPARPESVA